MIQLEKEHLLFYRIVQVKDSRRGMPTDAWDTWENNSHMGPKKLERFYRISENMEFYIWTKHETHT